MRRKRGEDLRSDGPTKAKTRLIERLGWKVLRFSWLQRMELDKRPEQERREFWVEMLRVFRWGQTKVEGCKDGAGKGLREEKKECVWHK